MATKSEVIAKIINDSIKGASVVSDPNFGRVTNHEAVALSVKQNIDAIVAAAISEEEDEPAAVVADIVVE